MKSNRHLFAAILSLFIALINNESFAQTTQKKKSTKTSATSTPKPVAKKTSKVVATPKTVATPAPVEVPVAPQSPAEPAKPVKAVEPVKVEEIKRIENGNDGGFPMPIEANSKIDSEIPKDLEVLSMTGEPAEFIGGMMALRKYLLDNLRYPEWEKENHIEGKVYMRFVVLKDGKVAYPKVMRSVEGSKNLDGEAIRLINGMPIWKPAKNNGKVVNMYFDLPIAFKLD